MNDAHTNVIQLSACLHRFHASSKDHEFASSLIAQYQSKGSLTSSQHYWVAKLLQRAQGSLGLGAGWDGPHGYLLKLNALIKSTGLSRPKLYVQHETGALRLTLTGPKSRKPGLVSVAHKTLDVWYGVITETGFFRPGRSPRPEQINAVLASLEKFAANPEAAAKAYAEAFCSCCFCGLALTDDRSKDVGYGPDCARKYSLRWGTYDPTAEASLGVAKRTKQTKAEKDGEGFMIW